MGLHNLNRYGNSDDGHVAVFFALLAVPTLMLVGLAVDSNIQNANRVRLKAALDSAALSAVTNQNITEAERRLHASQVFWANLGLSKDEVTFEVREAGGSRVSLAAEAKLDLTFNVFGSGSDLVFSETATAELTFGGVVCMLVLDPESANAFEVVPGGNLDASTCTVQVNSTNSEAASVEYGGVALAKNFCITGGAKGDFKPFVNTECGALSDPFAHKKVQNLNSCVDAKELDEKLSMKSPGPNGITLYPGVYCDGLELSHVKVTFSPGVYVMRDGPLLLEQGATVEAEDVTIVLQGDSATLEARKGSAAHFKAPATGDFAGFAFFQDRHYQAKNLPSLPSGVSNFAQGANVEITGIMYMPHQKISFLDGSQFDNQSLATSFIGHQISIGKGANVKVEVDHETAGVPPIEPRLDESARLTE